VVEVHQIEVNPAVTRAGDGDVPTPVGEAPQARLEERPADDIDNDLHTFTRRGRHDRIGEGPSSRLMY
jgi:hypothetical protein